MRRSGGVSGGGVGIGGERGVRNTGRGREAGRQGGRERLLTRSYVIKQSCLVAAKEEEQEVEG